MDFSSLLLKSEDLRPPANLSSSLGVTSTSSTSLLLGGMQGGSAPPPAKSQADDSPLLRSLSPILPLSQASPGRAQDVSLANVIVPLDAIKPSEFYEIGCMFFCVFVFCVFHEYLTETHLRQTFAKLFPMPFYRPKNNNT